MGSNLNSQPPLRVPELPDDSSTSQMSRRARTPQDLPLEIFFQIHEYLTPRELWPLLGVCRKWRGWMIGNKALWRELDISMFAWPGIEPGSRLFSTFSGGDIRSLTDDGTALRAAEEDMLMTITEAEKSALVEHIRGILCGILGTAYPRLRCLHLYSKAADKMVLSSILNKAAIRRMEICVKPGAMKEDLISLLFAFSGLEDLCICCFWNVDFYPLIGQHIEPPSSWGPRDCLKALKSLTLLARDHDARVYAAHVEFLNLESLSQAAPNIKILALGRGFIMRPAGFTGRPGQSDPRLDFSCLQKLRSFALQFTCFGLEMPSFPPTLEYLQLSAASVVADDASSRLQRIRGAPPLLPNLRLLRANFAGLTGDGSRDFWSDMVVRSRCRLQEIEFESAEDPSLVDYGEPGWSGAVCAELLRHDLLDRLECLTLRGSVREMRGGAGALRAELLDGMSARCPRLRTLVWHQYLCAGKDAVKRFLDSKPGLRTNLWGFRGAGMEFLPTNDVRV